MTEMRGAAMGMGHYCTQKYKILIDGAQLVIGKPQNSADSLQAKHAVTAKAARVLDLSPWTDCEQGARPWARRHEAL